MKRVLVRIDREITLEELADKYHTTVAAIRKLNALHEDIFVGMRLVIEENSGEYHTVQPFETLDIIAKKYGVSAQKIMDINDVDRVFIGQKVFIPL
ncbi:MAG: LysM peptidoglycan-binding domain-containing protein [Clostridia bacterium]|nr:LysM peptidoglycan-binding domain-containing protein [Clostridia bacterium]